MDTLHVRVQGVTILYITSTVKEEWINEIRVLVGRAAAYQLGNTSSRTTTEVKQR